MELRSHMISERTAPADHIIADRGAAGICGCGPLRDHVASQLHDHRWIAPAPRRPRSRSNTQLNRPSTDYATALPPGPRRTSALPLARLARAAVVGLLDRLDQLLLGHARAAADVEPLGDVHQVLLGGVGVDPAGRLATPPGGRAAAGRLRIARALLALFLPLVADLLERVLERGERGAVRPLALAVLLDRRVVRLAPGLLRLSGRAPQGAGQLLACRHGTHLLTVCSLRQCPGPSLRKPWRDYPAEGTGMDVAC